MATEDLTFTTKKGSPVKLTRSGGGVKVAVQKDFNVHTFNLIDVVKDTDGNCALVIDNNGKVEISESDAIQAREFLNKVRANPKSSAAPWLIGAVAVLGILVFIGSISGNKTPPTTTNDLSTGSVAGLSASSAASTSSSVSEEAAGDWTYYADSDSMTSKVSHFASVTSTNTVEFSFPYQGEQHATLMLRQHPRYGNDVILQIEKGQFLCPSFESCRVLIKFDDKPPVAFTAVGADDQSTETIFIRNYAKFAQDLKGTKHIIVEAPIYQEGNPQFDFDVGGFSASALSKTQP